MNTSSTVIGIVLRQSFITTKVGEDYEGTNSGHLVFQNILLIEILQI